MRENGVVAVRIRKGEKVFHVHGERAGAEGVWLAQGQVQGIYEPLVKTTYKAGAFQIGSRYKGRRIGHRDLVLGFHVTDTLNPWEFNESAFRQIFDYQPDPWDTARTPTTIEVETTISGVRKLDVLMHEPPDFDAPLDPMSQQYGNVIFKLRAGEQPLWYEDDHTTTFTSTAASASGTIVVENPTDQIMYQRWVLTRAEWTLPDVSWEGAAAARVPGGKYADRLLDKLTIGDVNGAAVVDLDRSKLMFRDANNTNLLAQMSGRFFLHAIPPNTPPTPLPISYTNAPAGGAMAQLIQPRRWTRPWGGELQSTVNYQPPLGITRFMSPGSWEYTIPPEATHLDVVLLGAGGGGGAGTIITGTGGSAGSWTTRTLVRATDLPAGTTTLSGTVGKGGAGGTLNPPQDGQTSTLDNPVLTAAGGTAAGHTGHVSGDDVHGPTLDFNGHSYVGGSTEGTPGNPGLAPGGGGAGGWPLSPGGAGARGQVWIRAYKS